MLDTNICIYLIKRKPVSVVRWIQSVALDEIGVSAITVAELEHGAAKSRYPRENRIALLGFLTPFRILDLGSSAAFEYGRIRTHLEKEGRIIGPMDMLIAAQAISENVILVTNNERKFRRLPQLRVENWV